MIAGRVFVDTNVLLYSLDSVNRAKQSAARRWLGELWESGSGCMSWQVLNEFYYNATVKLGASPAAIRSSVQLYTGWEFADLDLELLRRAWHWIDEAGLNYWDALILASAERLECGSLLSEDFQAGRQYGGVRIVNPFLTSPERL
ncbi:MAG TPA: PIN domain-containing protein [Bryobacteraceae bacterium]|jgi:predicted nucleic acid-binding protein